MSAKTVTTYTCDGCGQTTTHQEGWYHLTRWENLPRKTGTPGMFTTNAIYVTPFDKHFCSAACLVGVMEPVRARETRHPY